MKFWQQVGRFGTKFFPIVNVNQLPSATVNPLTLILNSSPIVFHIQADLTTKISRRGGKSSIQNKTEIQTI